MTSKDLSMWSCYAEETVIKANVETCCYSCQCYSELESLMTRALCRGCTVWRQHHLRMLIQCASKRTGAGGFPLMSSDTVICCLHQNLLLGGRMTWEKFRMACMKVPQWQTCQHHTPVGAKESSDQASSMILNWSWDSTIWISMFKQSLLRTCGVDACCAFNLRTTAARASKFAWACDAACICRLRYQMQFAKHKAGNTQNKKLVIWVPHMVTALCLG